MLVILASKLHKINRLKNGMTVALYHIKELGRNHMDADVVLHIRNYLILGSVVMAGSMVSEPFAIVAKPVLHLFSRIKHSMQVLRERIQCKCQNSFWEIDMTKFEP